METPEYELLAQRPVAAVPVEARNLPLVSESSAPLEVSRLYAQFRSRFGLPQVPGILQCFATHPPLLEHMMAMSETLLFPDGALTRRQKEMIATFVSSTNHCNYCSDSHGFFYRVHGGSIKSLVALLACDPQSGIFTKAEHALLEFVAAVNRGGESVTPKWVTKSSQSRLDRSSNRRGNSPDRLVRHIQSRCKCLRPSLSRAPRRSQLAGCPRLTESEHRTSPGRQLGCSLLWLDSP
jgi:AhpD family alkylhydroperoxidase